jgi:hypothetical protein
MKTSVAVLAFAITVFALPSENVCPSKQTVVCHGQGNGGLISLGNVLPGVLGENCAGGDVYCCSSDDVAQVNIVLVC